MCILHYVRLLCIWLPLTCTPCHGARTLPAIIDSCHHPRASRYSRHHTSRRRRVATGHR
jgi:hypothetical protein